MGQSRTGMANLSQTANCSLRVEGAVRRPEWPISVAEVKVEKPKAMAGSLLHKT